MPHTLITRSRAVLAVVATLGLVAGSLGSAAASADPIAVAISGTVSPQWGGGLYGARVELFGADDTAPLESVVAEDGTFSFAVTEPGDYRVRASAATFDTRWWGDASAFADAAIIPVLDIDVPGIDITLPLTQYTVQGTVTGGDPIAPLEGIGVEVRGIYGGTTELVTTDSSGHYEIGNLPEAGTVHFVGTDGFASEWYNDVPDEASASILTFNAHHTADAELAQAGTIAGTVRGPLVIGGPAVALGESTATLYTAGGSMVTGVNADDQGAYVFEGVAAGSYRLSFTGPGSSADWSNGYLGGADRLSLSPLVTLTTGGAVENMDAALARVPVLAGTVIDAATGQPRSNGDGNPAHLTLRSLTGAILDHAWTRADGTYQFRDLDSGSYLVHVYASDSRSASWVGGPTYASATPITVKRGVSTVGKNLTIVAGGSIEGTVAANGSSILGTEVKLLAPQGQEIQSQYVRSDGDYSFYGIRPGDYLVKVVPKAGVLVGEYWDDARTRQQARKVRVTAGETTVLGRIELSSVATGALTGRALGGVGTTVYASGTGGVTALTYSAQVDENSTYTITGVAPGAYTLYFADGQSYRGVYGRSTPSTLTVVAGRTTTARAVSLREKVVVSVSAAAGADPVDALAEFYDLSGAWMAEARTGYEGTQVELPRGQYKVRFSNADPDSTRGLVWLGGRADFAKSSVLDLRTVSDATIAADIAAGSSFSAKVVEAAKGRALDIVSVVAWQRQPNGGYAATRGAQTRTDGKFTVTGLGAGVYKFQFVDEVARTYHSGWLGGGSLATAKPVTVGLAPKTLASSAVTRLGPATGTVAVKLPTISGTIKVGRTLTAKTSSTWPSSGVKKSYRWYRNGVAITGASKSTYVLKKVDAGKEITVRIVGSRAGYTSSGTSSLPRNTRD